MDIERGKGSPRVHITDPRQWAGSLGTDYWAHFGPEVITPSGLIEPPLSDFGWVTTSIADQAGSGADFMSSSDPGTPNAALTNASGDILQSPSIFGDYAHSQAAAAILGYTPTKLICEFYGALTVASADEPVSGFGLIEAGGSPVNGADQMAYIRSNGTVFLLGAAVDGGGTGSAVDANWHKWRITVTNTGAITDAISWSKDGVAEATTIDLQNDLWPVSFGMHALTTNRPAVSWVHLWYE